MRTARWLVLLCWLCLVPVALPAAAADGGQDGEPAKETIELGEVEVVTSPLVETTMTTRYGTQVSSVTERQIEAMNAHDFAAAVRRVPGVTISRFNHVGSFGGREGGAVFVRGMGGSRPGGGVLTMVDGIPLFVGVWAHPLLDPLNVENAERIDVYKGANPIVVGNAGFGAFDLVLKRQLEPGFTTSLFGAVGTHNTWMETIEHGGRTGAWDYYVLQSYKSSDGHRDHSAGELQNYYVHVGRQLNEVWNLNYSFVHTDNWAEDPGHEGGPPPERALYKTRTDLHILSLENRSGEAQGHLKLYWDNLHADWEQFDTEPFDSVTDHDNYGLRARQTFWPWDGGELVAGFDWDNIGGRFVERRPGGDKSTSERFHIVSPYGAVSHTFGEADGWHVTPSLGLRYNNHNEFKDVWTPQAGLVVGNGATELHAGYARGVNYPGVYAVHFFEQVWGAGGGWQDLDPELLDHYEVGVSHRFAPWLTANATAFWDRGEDRIRFVAPPPPPPTFQNIGEFQTEGFEFSAELTPQANWSAFVGATFLTDIEPRNLPYAPKRSFSAGVSWLPAERWRLDLDGQYVSEFFTDNPRFPDTFTEVDGYYLVNTKVGYDFTPAEANWQGEAFAAVENLFDQDYEYRDGYPMPGATLMTGIRLTF